MGRDIYYPSSRSIHILETIFSGWFVICRVFAIDSMDHNLRCLKIQQGAIQLAGVRDCRPYNNSRQKDKLIQSR